MLITIFLCFYCSCQVPVHFNIGDLFSNLHNFHEDVINTIANDLIKLLNPRYLEVEGLFKSRGGISIVPFVNFGRDEFEAVAKKILIER